MQVMWLGVVISILIAATIRAEHLIGEHVCPEQEKYTVTVERQFKKNVTVREFVWCMNVPPRCSKYSIKEKVQFKIEEEERMRLVDKCCPGYMEDKNRTYCIPACSECIHGECLEPERCTCSAGYTGKACNQTCPAGRWGPACVHECDCKLAAACNATDGSCLCSSGESPLPTVCETLCSQNSTNQNCTNQCICGPTEECNIATKECVSILKTKTNTIDIINIANFAETAPEVGPSTQETKPSYTTHPEMEITKDETETLEIASDKEHVTSSILDAIVKSKKNSEDTGKMRQFSDENSEQWLMDEIRIENNKLEETKHGTLVSTICVTVGTAFILVLIAVISVLIARYRKRRAFAVKNKSQSTTPRDNNENRISNQPIIKRSTFHAPLPDPPLFQNPVFTLINDEKHTCKMFSNQVYYNNSGEMSELQYDYPPSTGSYCAASIPDPGFEPVYDEIPAWRRPRPVTDLPKVPCTCQCNGRAISEPHNQS